MHENTWDTVEMRALRDAAIRERPLMYTDIRRDIRDGDLLLFQGTKLLSRVIRWGSRSPYSHSGVAAWWDDRLMVFQAGARGVEVLPMSSAVDAYDGQVDWYALQEQYFAKINRRELVNTAVTLLGRAYATKGLLNLMVRMARKQHLGLPDDQESPSSMFCSQYVSYCYRLAGLDLVDHANDACTTPADLAKSKFVARRGVLRANPQDKERRERESLPGVPRGQLSK